ncbi:MAG TPA: circularly permuted type 2 ATP-grasp protein, partial [Ilumatobacteraceae bacterium]
MLAPTTSDLLPGYAPQPDGYDEAVGPTGETRPTWRALSRAVALMTPSDIAAHQRQADRLVEAEGASYLFHDEGEDVSRPWRLDPLPLVISGTEWAEIERGVSQRVRLLDRLIADVYGEQRLLRDRFVAPAAVFSAPGYHVGARGATPPQGRWLTIYAADLLRLADGQWRVLRDLTDAPSGAGYALVNRNVCAQLLPDVARDVAPMSL